MGTHTKYDIKRLEAVQKWDARFVYVVSDYIRTSSVPEMLYNLLTGILWAVEGKHLDYAYYMYKILHNLASHWLYPSKLHHTSN